VKVQPPPLIHFQYEELLGAYALDAVDGTEAAAVEIHLMECPRCRDEVARHRETAALLGHVGVSAPVGLWDRISGELSKVPPALALVRVPTAAAREARPGSTTGGTATGGTTRRRRRVSVKPVVALVSAAAVVIGVLAFELTNLQGQVAQVRNSLTAGSIQRLADAALSAPGREIVTMRSPSSRERAAAVIVPNGQGYLIDATLPRLPSHQTYQLWSLLDGNAISLGLLGRSPTQAAFHVDFSQVSELMITVEPAALP
jgi:hypothetical protein